MLKVRKSQERGYAKHDWLETRYSFSFADYHDQQQMGFRNLRVINQDIVQPGQGFPTHSHQDMEILTLVLRGAVAHQDSMGNSALIKSGEIQRMSAGTGVRHSEFNPSDTELLELLQIWILPETKGIKPGYQQTLYNHPTNALELLVAPHGDNKAISIHQDIKLWLGNVTAPQTLLYKLNTERYAWIQIISGELAIRDILLQAGDGIAVSQEENLLLITPATSEFLLFDLN